MKRLHFQRNWELLSGIILNNDLRQHNLERNEIWLLHRVPIHKRLRIHAFVNSVCT